jgi:hypothetical protein
MGQLRLRMISRDGRWLVETLETVQGRRQMVLIRKTDTRFKGRRIKPILQMMPSAVPLMDIVPTT